MLCDHAKCRESVESLILRCSKGAKDLKEVKIRVISGLANAFVTGVLESGNVKDTLHTTLIACVDIMDTLHEFEMSKNLAASVSNSAAAPLN